MKDNQEEREYEEYRIQAQCSDGCTIFQIVKNDYSSEKIGRDVEIFLEAYISASTNGFFGRLKVVWDILVHNKYSYAEAVLINENADEFENSMVMVILKESLDDIKDKLKNKNWVFTINKTWYNK